MVQIHDLPYEIFLLIFEQIEPLERRRWLEVSKAYNRFASPVIFRDLVLHARKPDEFLKDINELVKGGMGEKYLIHARSVKIWDSSTLLPVSHYGCPNGRCPDDGCPDDKWKRLQSGDRKDIRYMTQWVAEFEDKSMPKDSEEVNWKPLAAKLKQFEEINNLIWVCQKRFPPCLLEAIREKHKKCQLHLRTFVPRSVSEAGINHADDFELIKSPNLHSITIKLHPARDPRTSEDSKREFDWHEIAALQLISTVPNIKHVNIVTGEKPIDFLYPSYIAELPHDREELWKAVIEKKASLTSLIFNRWRLMELNDIEKWSRCIDLSQVRHLTLGSVSDPLVLSYLIENVGSWSLKTFGINLALSTEVIDKFTSLVDNLNYLSEIHLGGYLSDSLLDKVLKRHGPKLRRMTLSPTYGIGRAQIQIIERHCQCLQFLKMAIKEPRVDAKFSDVCPNLETLQELTLQIRPVAGPNTPGMIGATIGRRKRTRLRLLKIFDNEDMWYFKRTIAQGILEVNRESHEEAPSRMIETELTEMFHGLPTAKFREGEPIYPYEGQQIMLWMGLFDGS